ncbi:SIR2 family protein [Candidatus Poriferisodalis sp.]|uniref:SIR2 family protein n=1 Tax=Candidatus Poriferisodalis sp. TaxID=3101277 RepID=UPI003D102FDD
MPLVPMASLASSMHAGPGSYALLLGSGIGRSSGVPTGWDVTIDLIKRFAAALGQDHGGDPIGWYRSYTGGEPDYSVLLEDLAPSPEDRRNLLEGYFQPTDDEREEGIKMPGPAHRTIADLVKAGVVRVIVTTNFDRLLEQALSEIGVQPTVISSAAHAQGALPLVHSGCTIIKVHGDYLSPDLKNTVEELDSYDPAIDALLDRVFDEYGLGVCGWSATWDAALRNALLRAPNRRFATYWMHRGDLTAQADELVAHRGAIQMQVTDADTAFDELAQTVAALEEATDRDPQGTATAVARLKRYLSDPVHRIRLHDLMVQETEGLIDTVADLPTTGVDVDAVFPKRMHKYEMATTQLMALLATGAFFSQDDDRDQTWVATIDRLARREMAQSGYDVLLNMQQYPTLLAMYAVAFGAAAAGRIDPVARVLGSVKVAEHGLTVPVGVAASSFQVLDYDRMRATVPGLERHRVPFSKRLFDALRPTVTEIIRDDQRYKELFDQIEYLFGLACYAGIGVGPVGLGAHRRPVGPVEPPDGLIQSNRDALIEAGVFTDANHLEACRAAYNEEFESAHRRRW